MLGSIALILVGLAALAAGGELLVRGASGIGRLLSLTPTVIGLTIVAAGTSMPELVVSLRAALAGNTSISLGNVVGSNIFNISAILGVAALVSPLRLVGRTVRFEWPVMFLASWQLFLLIRDGTLDRLEGAFLFTSLVIFLVYIVIVARREAGEREREEFADLTRDAPSGSGSRAWLLSAGATVFGGAILAVGADVLVRGAVDVAARMQVSEVLIGLTVVAAGTSLPELAASVMASLRGNSDIAVANVIGSNIFNVLGIAGLTATLHPLPVPGEVLARDCYWMLALSVLLLPIMRSDMRVGRLEGLALAVLFCVYIGVLAAPFLG